MTGRELLRREPDGSLVRHADLSGLSRYGWNEIVVDGRGNIYVNSVGFNFGQEAFRPGIIALVTPDGAVRQVADDIHFPNGMVVTPDNQTLIVAESFAGRLTAFDIAPDGGLSNRRVWADLGGPGAGDGICLDAEGAIWCSEVREDQPAACASARAARCCSGSSSSGPASPACSGARTADAVHDGGGVAGRGAMETLFRSRTGQVLTAPAPAPRAGWP